MKEDLTYEIDPTLVGGAGAESVSPAAAEKLSDGEEKEKWIAGIKEELKSLQDM